MASGLHGLNRLPRDSVRARRNATQFASNFTSLLGDGLAMSGAGLIAIDLAANKGLEFVGGDLAVKIQSPLICDAGGLGIDPGDGMAISGTELVVDLAADPGLAFSGGDLTAKVAAPIALDATGIHLDYGTGLQNDAGILKTDDAAIDHDALLNFLGAEHIDWAVTGAEDIHVDRITSAAVTQHVADIDHDALLNFAGGEHFVQTAITNISSALATGLVKVTTGTGALSVVTDNTANWDTAFTHVSNDGTDHGYIDQDVRVAASPTFAGMTLGALAGVLKGAAGVVSGGANLNDLDDVNAGAPADDEILSWDAATSKWVPVAAGAGGGEINTASSAGVGTSLYFQKVGVDLEFNAIKSENNRLTVGLDGVSHDVELTVNEANIDHDALANFAGNEHTDHTAVTLTAGEGMSGGGTIAANRTFDVEITNRVWMGC